MDCIIKYHLSMKYLLINFKSAYVHVSTLHGGTEHGHGS